MGNIYAMVLILDDNTEIGLRAGAGAISIISYF